MEPSSVGASPILEQTSFADLLAPTSSPASADGTTRSSSPAGPMMFPSGPEVARASRSVSQEIAAAKAIPATSGPIFDALSPSAALQSSLESRLRARLAASGSPQYALTWKRWDMPQGGGDLCAASTSTLHARQRLFWGAYSDRLRFQGLEPQPRASEGARTREQFEGLVQEQIRLSVPAGRFGARADAVPGRVGQLRGYGNAIVAPLAAQFVMAFMEAIKLEGTNNAAAIRALAAQAQAATHSELEVKPNA